MGRIVQLAQTGVGPNWGVFLHGTCCSRITIASMRFCGNVKQSPRSSPQNRLTACVNAQLPLVLATLKVMARDERWVQTARYQALQSQRYARGMRIPPRMQDVIGAVLNIHLLFVGSIASKHFKPQLVDPLLTAAPRLLALPIVRWSNQRFSHIAHF